MDRYVGIHRMAYSGNQCFSFAVVALCCFCSRCADPGSQWVSEPRFPQRQQTKKAPLQQQQNKLVPIGKSFFFAVVAFLLSLRGAFFFLLLRGRVFFAFVPWGALFLLSLRGCFFCCCGCGPRHVFFCWRCASRWVIVTGKHNDSKKRSETGTATTAKTEKRTRRRAPQRQQKRQRRQTTSTLIGV